MKQSIYVLEQILGRKGWVSVWVTELTELSDTGHDGNVWVDLLDLLGRYHPRIFLPRERFNRIALPLLDGYQRKPFDHLEIFFRESSVWAFETMTSSEERPCQHQEKVAGCRPERTMMGCSDPHQSSRAD